MLQRARPLALLVTVAAVGLVASGCGSSDSSSPTNSTKSATVPSGKLGDTGMQTCIPPRVPHNVVVFNPLSVTNLECNTASAALMTRWTTGTLAGWTCTKKTSGPSGRQTALTCANDADTTQTFSTSWYRS